MKHSPPRVITVDGPSASGKSSVARDVAQRLGWIHVNTGNMYRAATWAVLEAGVSPQDATAVLQAVSRAKIENKVTQGHSVVTVNGRELDNELNSEAINNAVSFVARIPEVRDQLVAMQRELGHEFPVVMEGRDIGTVVFPEARCKFYIDADEEVRNQRRAKQGLTDSLKKRDLIDSTRKTAPLRPAPDAVVIDSSHLSQQDVVERVMEVLEDRGYPPVEVPRCGKMTLSYWLGYHFFRTMGRALFNYQIVNEERLNFAGGALVVGNHVSFLDPPLIGVAFPQAICYLARKTLFDHPIVGRILRSWNAIPVDQDRPDMTSLKKVIRNLRDGEKVLVFPEGSRSFSGEIDVGQPGVGLIVTKAQVPVVPMRIFGSHEALPRGGKRLVPSQITIVAGNPWHYRPENYPGLSGKDLYLKISQDLMAEVAALHL